MREERAAEEAAAKQSARAGEAQAGGERATGRTKPDGGVSQAKLERRSRRPRRRCGPSRTSSRDPSAWATPERSAESSARHEAAKRAVDELYARYEQVAG